MNLVRSMAVGISHRVVRWAAPGCKDWAEGLEREVEFIESDWRALAWAVGSTWVLLERREVDATSEGKIRAQAPRFVDIFIWGCYACWIFDIWIKISAAKSTFGRIEVSLALFPLTYWLAASIAKSVRGKPSWLDTDARRMFDRKELERKLARYRTVRRWFPALATLSFTTALVMEREGGIDLGLIWFAILAGGSLFAMWMNLFETPEKIQKDIERMDERIAEARIAKAQQNAQYRRARSDHWGRAESASTMARKIADSE
jgi:hypothetical protein